MTLGRKLVRLGLTHEGSAEAFRTEALQMAPISTTLLTELHHTIKQRYRQAYATAGEDTPASTTTSSSSFSSGLGMGKGMEGFVMSPSCSASSPSSSSSSSSSSKGGLRHARKDGDELKPVFIKPVAKTDGQGAVPGGERKSILGLDRLAAMKRAEKMMKEKLEHQDEDEGEEGGDFPSVKKEEEEDGREDNVGGGVGFRKTSTLKMGGEKRPYRSRREPDTPSHPGGVNREAQREVEERERQRGRGAGLALTERGSAKELDGRRDRERERERERKEEERRRRRHREEDRSTDRERGRDGRDGGRDGRSSSSSSSSRRPRSRSRSRPRERERERGREGGRRRSRSSSPPSSSSSSSSSSSKRRRSRSRSRSRERNERERPRSERRDDSYRSSSSSSSSSRRREGESRSSSSSRARREAAPPTPSRSGLGMDEDEWEAPESLQSVRRWGGREGATPGATPLASPSPRATPSDSVYGRASIDPAEVAWEAEQRDRGRGREGRKEGGREEGGETPFDWRAAMREDGREAAYFADGRRGGDRNGGSRRGRSGREEEEEEEEEYFEAFYLSEEGVSRGEEAFLGDPEKIREKEEAMLKAQEKGEASKRRQQQQNSRKNQLAADQNAWEENRLLTSGVAVRNEVDMDFVDEEETRVRLNVHHTKPPFIDGRVTFSKQLTTVSVVKEPTSDMAILSKKGSALVRERRERRERGKMRQRFWELGGSRMGEAMGLKEEGGEGGKEGASAGGPGGAAGGGGGEGGREGGKEEEDDDYDYRKESKFSDHLKEMKKEGQSEFSKNKSIAEQRQYLPIYTVREELLTVIRENPIVIIVGETGSGKTTQMTQYLHEEGFTDLGMVACTQPRRVAATTVAMRVADEMGVELGEEVGYSIRFDDCTSDKTLIKYMTDGILLRESLREPDLDSYAAIVMDEAHERSLNTDVLFGMLRKVAQRRRDLKLIVTSATLDSKRFSEFFGGVPVFEIPGRTFPVERVYAKTSVEDYVDAAVKQALAIHLSHPPGDILLFMTGQEDIETVCEVIAERMMDLGTDRVPPLLLLPLFSNLSSDQQSKAFEATEKSVRKCVVSTNIAETSVTVDGVKYVIDCGFSKLKVYNPSIGMDSLLVTPVAQANSDQRAGRAGRTGPGHCYRLYTERQYRDELLKTQVPEIQRTNLANVVLLLKSLGVTDLKEFDFMDPPPQENLQNSMYQLWILGALDNTGQLTPLGRKMAEFPIDPPLAKMLIVSHDLKCSEEVLIVVSMLSAPPVFFRPKDRAEESDAKREKFFVPESDHLTHLNVYLQWKKNRYSAQWCGEHFLHAKSLKKAREIHGQLSDIMQSQRMPLVAAGNSNWDRVRKAICSAYFYNSALMKGLGDYRNLLTGIPCHVHPTSALAGLGYTPDYVTYHELVMTSKSFMQCVTAIEPEWLAELGPAFFSLHESSVNRMARRREEAALKESMEKEMKVALQREEEEKAARLAAQLRETPKVLSGRMATPGRWTPRRVGL